MPQDTEHRLHDPYAPYLATATAAPQERVSTAGPTHEPPQAVLAHERLLVCVPLPQDVEQALHAPYAPYLAGVIAAPQDLVSIAAPTQFPPQALLMHVLLLVCLPRPHETEHLLHAPYPVHLEGVTTLPQERDSVAGPTHDPPQGPLLHVRLLV